MTAGTRKVFLDLKPAWKNYFFGLLFAWLVIPFLNAWAKRESFRLIVTHDRVVAFYGLIGRTVVEIALKDVRTVTYTQTPMQRGFGLGNICVAAAGTSGYEIVVPGIQNPARVVSLILSLRERAREESE